MDNKIDKQPFIFQPEGNRFSAIQAKQSLESINSHRLTVDYQLELSKSKHELISSQKAYQELNLQFKEFMLKYEILQKESYKVKQDKINLEKELFDSSKTIMYLKEELQKSMETSSQMRQKNMHHIEDINKLNMQINELKDVLQQGFEIQKQDDQRIQLKKQFEEELNKCVNELHFKFQKREKKLINQITKLKDQLNEDINVHLPSNQSTRTRWTKTDGDLKNSQQKQLMEIFETDDWNDVVYGVQVTLSELQKFKKITQNIFTQIYGEQNLQEFNSNMLFETVNELLHEREERKTRQNSVRPPSGKSSHKPNKILDQIGYFLGVKNYDQILTSLSEKIMEYEGNKRILKHIVDHLQIEECETLIQMEHYIYEKLGINS